MLKVKAGDLDKMGLLFDRYNRPLFGYLFHSTGHRLESEDLVQTVFYRMLKYRQSFSETGEFRAWMYQLARNALIDSAKKRSRTVYEEDIATASELYQKNENLEENLHENEAAQLLQKALNKLPDDQRELLLLSKFQELPYREIAEIMGTSEGNIKVKIHRAINELRSIYIKENGRFQ
jgi:RNA polymerase sigma factor (sigma-70 family)